MISNGNGEDAIMSSLFNSPSDNEMITCRSRVGWDELPPEIFLYIFKKLNITALRCCLSVNKKWREIATCICEQQDCWQAVAEDGMVNHGVTQHLKSTLSWKDLYFNSFLWNKLPLVTTCGHHEFEMPYIIRNVCVYRDKLIVVNRNGIEYYDIESLQPVRKFLTPDIVDLQESDDILMVVTNSNFDGYYRVTVFIKLHKDNQINVNKYLNTLIMPGNESVHAFVDCWNWRLVGNRVYALDKRSVLWKCTSINKTLSVTALARYYGELSRRHSTIHVLEGDDVYLSLQFGTLMSVGCWFRKVISNEIPTKTIRRSNLNTLPHSEASTKFYALVKFPYDLDFTKRYETPLNIIHYYYDDPEMTYGLQHGDVIFRGFVNGEITIHLLRSGYKHSLNVRQFDQNEVKNPAVIALEVCELKNMHQLFVATKHKLYAILMKYPDDGLET